MGLFLWPSAERVRGEVGCRRQGTVSPRSTLPRVPILPGSRDQVAEIAGRTSVGVTRVEPLPPTQLPFTCVYTQNSMTANKAKYRQVKGYRKPFLIQETSSVWPLKQERRDLVTSRGHIVNWLQPDGAMAKRDPRHILQARSVLVHQED